MHNGTTAIAGSMVRDRLSRCWSGLQHRVQQHQGLSITAAAVGSGSRAGGLGLGGPRRAIHAGVRPSLMELLDQVEMKAVDKAGESASSLPLPPKSRSWSCLWHASARVSATRCGAMNSDARSSNGGVRTVDPFWTTTQGCLRPADRCHAEGGGAARNRLLPELRLEHLYDAPSAG